MNLNFVWIWLWDISLWKKAVGGPVLPCCGSLREPGSLARVILNETPEKCQFWHSAAVPFEMKLWKGVFCYPQVTLRSRFATEAVQALWSARGEINFWICARCFSGNLVSVMHNILRLNCQSRANLQRWVLIRIKWKYVTKITRRKRKWVYHQKKMYLFFSLSSSIESQRQEGTILVLSLAQVKKNIFFLVFT